jgi:hypothetical protein
VSAMLKFDETWAPGEGTWIAPNEGWGYAERIDGQLAPPFEIRIDEVGVDVGDGIRGWRGVVATPGHKYDGLHFRLTPRHTRWTGIVVIEIKEQGELIFSGMAETRGLECSWL